MSDLPKLAIAMVTYRRTQEALRTIQSTCENLQYPKELRSWYIGDDGSAPAHMESLLQELEKNDETLLGSHSERFRLRDDKDTNNAGLGWNRALGLSHQFSDYVLWLEDDWVLETPLDLLPYVKLLQENENIGICTFRILSVGADVHTLGYDGRMYLRYARTTQYAFSGNPYLRHARYTTKYGWFAEDRNPGLMELHQDDQYRLAMEGPEIWRPLDISIWGGWSHIGTDKTW